MAVILGRKVGVTSFIGAEGDSIPMTVVQAGPCRVVEKRDQSKHGYSALVLGFEPVDGAKVRSKSLLGFFKKVASPCYRVLREFRIGNIADGVVGSDLTVEQFSKGDIVRVEGISKGHGWTSVIKKWNFGTGRESHGGNCQRKMGSSGMHTWPAHVIKGKKMSGRWGSETVSIRSVEVLGTIPEDGLLLIKGLMPGNKGGLLKIERLKPAKVAA